MRRDHAGGAASHPRRPLRSDQDGGLAVRHPRTSAEVPVERRRGDRLAPPLIRNPTPMPTDWEAQYEKGETPWEKGAPSPGLVDFLATEPVCGRVLVPGCGFGHDVRALAATAQEVVGLDSRGLRCRRGAKVSTHRYRELRARRSVRPTAGNTRRVRLGFRAHLFLCHRSQTAPCLCRSRRRRLETGWKASRRLLSRSRQRFPGRRPSIRGFSPWPNSDRLSSLPHFTLDREWLPQHAYPGREGREWMRVMRLAETRVWILRRWRAEAFPGRVGVPLAVACILRNTIERSYSDPRAGDVRMVQARRLELAGGTPTLLRECCRAPGFRMLLLATQPPAWKWNGSPTLALQSVL